jgi:hypothetical protein
MEDKSHVTRLRKLLPVLAVLGGIALAAPSARAGIVLAPGPNNPTITPVSGGFKWSYNVQIPGALNVQPGDSFTILDFAGFKTGTAFAPTSDWTFSSSMTGPADPHHILTPPDNPNLPNLTWTYHGAKPISGNGSGVQVTLFGFGAVSTGGTSQEGLVVSFVHRDSDGKFVVAASAADVPVAGHGPSGAPEPATLVLFGLGLPCLGLGGLLRRRKVAAA